MQKLDFVKEILFDEETVTKRINEIRGEILSYYKEIKKPIYVFSVLKGGRYFSNLLFPSGLPQNRRWIMRYISASSYRNNEKLPNNEIKIDLMGVGIKCLWGAHALIIDDIYDTGNTLNEIIAQFWRNGATVNSVVLIKRTGHHKFVIPMLSYGFEVTSKDYLVGCGLDYNGGYRQIPYIASIKEIKDADRIPNNSQ
jgi:hypoxanthine phosphoribosyltransferase